MVGAHESDPRPARFRFCLDEIKQIIKGLSLQYDVVTDSTLTYLRRDGWLQHHSEFGSFLEGIKKCVDFAKQKKLKLSPVRGSAPASLALYSLGFSGVDPMKYDMIPERLATQTPFFHIDVEFDRGQEFVNFCRDVNRSLPYGEIQAFKMPLIDIVQGIHSIIEKEIDYESIDDDSDIVLSLFRNLDIKNIFQFDFSEDALVMLFEELS